MPYLHPVTKSYRVCECGVASYTSAPAGELARVFPLDPLHRRNAAEGVSFLYTPAKRFFIGCKNCIIERAAERSRNAADSVRGHDRVITPPTATNALYEPQRA